MKTIITAIALSSMFVLSPAYAEASATQQDEQQTIETMVEQSIAQQVYDVGYDVKLDALVEFGQYVAELKASLSPARVLNQVVEASVDLIMNHEE